MSAVYQIARFCHWGKCSTEKKCFNSFLFVCLFLSVTCKAANDCQICLNNSVVIFFCLRQYFLPGQAKELLLLWCSKKRDERNVGTCLFFMYSRETYVAINSVAFVKAVWKIIFFYCPAVLLAKVQELLACTISNCRSAAVNFHDANRILTDVRSAQIHLKLVKINTPCMK